MRSVLIVAGLAGLCLGAHDGRAGAADEREEAIRRSVVKVFSTMRNPDLQRPWLKHGATEATGTGVVIEGRRILTNAHVVTYASQVSVQGNQDADKVRAKVVAVAPGIDLAVLSLEDESFFEKRAPLSRRAELPEIKEGVLVYGYPTGGSGLSVTKGSVNRVEYTSYATSTSGLRIQVDAAINPGNSGGPALVGDRMIGLAFSRLNRADNIGYIIPAEEVDAFLKDIEDGHYDGKPAIFDAFQTLENDALRGFLKLDRKTTGIVVSAPDRPGSNPLKEWDLVAKVGGRQVDDVGHVQLDNGLRLAFQYLIPKLDQGGKVPLTVVRDGKETTVEVPTHRRRDLLVPNIDGAYPSYFIAGPLVFTAATQEYVAMFEAAMGHFATIMSLRGSPLVTRRAEPARFEGEQLVVVAGPMFPHRIAQGYSDPATQVVEAVNGVKVRNLRHLAEMLRDGKDKYVRISFAEKGTETIVFDRAELDKATEDVLADNGIRKAASDDLADVWKK